MDYTREASYTSFLISEMMEHVKMEAAIKEAVILAEGGEIPEFNIIHESFFDKVKETWDKFVAFIKRIWAKFTESMMSVLDVDKPYLEKYRDIILKKPVQFTTVSMRTYNIERILQAKLDAFDYNIMKEDLKDPSKLAHRFIDKFDTAWDTEDFGGWCKAYFCNGSEEVQDIDPTKLDMASMFDYCVTWKDKMKPALEKDVQAINNSNTKAYNLIKNVPKRDDKPTSTAETPASANTASNPTPAASTNNQQNSGNTNTSGATPTSGAAKPNEESFFFTNNTTYSFLYEAETKIDSGKSTSDTSTGKTGPTVSAPQTAGGVASKTTVDANKTKVDAGDDAYEDIDEAIKCYTKIAGAVASSKLTVAGWAYKEYMQVIRAHVKSHIAAKEPVADEAPGKGQTYTAPQGGEQQQSGEQGQQAAGSGKQPPRQP